MNGKNLETSREYSSESVREDVLDLARLLAALVAVEVVASLTFAFGLVGWSIAQEPGATALEATHAALWVASMTLSSVLLGETYQVGGLEDVAAATACYALGVLVVAIAVRVLEARGESR